MHYFTILRGVILSVPSQQSVLNVEAVGQSEAFLEFQETLSRVAPINRPVLLLGERGTGKELAASRLHYLSNRWQGPLITMNCAALTPTLIESELFGYEEGAFTGAKGRRPGRFEAASGGSLFLDEIGAIPLEVQEKILRAVEYGVFERVGSSSPIEVDVRIIGATNADLLDLSQKGLFKQDLLDRLSFEVLYLPPLRERTEDIALLAEHFARRMAFEIGRDEAPTFSEPAMRRLISYPWEGNVRQLKNVVERAVYRSISSKIDRIIFNPFRPSAEVNAPSDSEALTATTNFSEDAFLKGLEKMPLKSAIEALEIHRLKKALVEAKYNQKKAAAILGLTYDQFRSLKRKYQKLFH